MMRMFTLWSVIGSLFLASANGQEKPVLTEAETTAIAAIRKSGGQVMELAQNDSHLDVAFHLADGKITDDQLAPLASLPQVAQVNLRGREITNAGLAHLYLWQTKVTDAGVTGMKTALPELQIIRGVELAKPAEEKKPEEPKPEEKK